MTQTTPVAANDAVSIVAVELLDLRVVPHAWEFATARRAEIEAFFAERQRERSGMWNGRILLLQDFAVEHGIFRGAFFETDFAAFDAWCCWGFPDAGVKNAFGVGALRSADGAFVLGEMAGHTANAGHIYFPCGTPDPDDVSGSQVDFASSVRREVLEETGIGEDAYVADPGWLAVIAGPRIALIQRLRASANADVLRRRIADHLARQTRPELSRIHLVRSVAEFDPRMPDFVTAFLAHVWNG